MMAATVTNGMPLSLLLRNIAVVPAARERLVDDVTVDSREVRPGACFIALAGSRDDGAKYIGEAVTRGAVAVVAERPLVPLRADIALLHAPALRQHLGVLGQRFFDHPSAALKLCAVTGTNGKTSVAHLLAQAVELLGGHAGYIGTLGAGPLGALCALANTTPDVITLNRWLARFRDQGASVVALEASSHALDQQRLAALSVHAAAFTNLGHDHLDYHHDMSAYAAAKRRLFAQPGLARAAINIDDSHGAALARELPPHIEQWTCSSRGARARVHAADIALTAAGVELSVTVDGRHQRVASALTARFQVDNMLLAIALLLASGHELGAICAVIGRLTGVPGRAQDCGTTSAGARVFVDFAHSPDSLRAILATLRTRTPRRVWLVFGCGGDRDRSKRPLMGAVAEQGAEQVILTTDNPRGENPASIAADILGGMRQPARAIVIEDRALAIRTALADAGADDIVLIAGKGHETTQERAGQRSAFSDQVEIARALAERTP